MNDQRYIPALSFDSLTPLYDPVLRWVMREDQFKRALIQQAALAPGQRVLDLGCGTATLTILLKQAQPAVEVVGLDGDPRVLEVGRAKARRAGVSITLEHGLADRLPYPAASFDRVISSLVIHHLTSDDKHRAFAEVYRVLKPGGDFHLVDFGPPRSAYTKLISGLTRRLERAEDNIAGALPAMLRGAGFPTVEATAHFETVFGTLTLLRLRKESK